MSGAKDELLRLAGVDYDYGTRRVLCGANFRLRVGERVALVGSNGAGKTTLMHVLVGLKRPQAGDVIAFGRTCRDEADFLSVRAQVGLLFQNSDDQLFCPTVLDDVAFGPLNLGRSVADARGDAEQALADLGLEAFAERVTHQLSAGEKRMVALATVLAMRPRVLLLDEPTNGLDRISEERLIAHLGTLDQAMVIVSHDRHLLGQLSNRALVLKDGRLNEAVLHRHPHVHRHEHLHLHVPDQVAPVLYGAGPTEPVPEHSDHHAAE
ncbi:MAG: ABC transporter ATP-binding protein [Thiohalocapsa sp.]